MLIDSHCHIDVEEFDHDRDLVIARTVDVGVTKIIVPGIERSRWGKQLNICNQYEQLYPALGLHPIFLASHQQSDLQVLGQYIDEYRPVAIGEIGLDFYISNLDRNQQLFYLHQQLKLAQQASLPVILHVRKAHDQMLHSLKKIKVIGGICHAFNGSLQQAEQYIKLGFKLGFGGMLSYEHSSRLRRLARELPVESIVLETDAPDMTVASHRGERNSPEYLPECLAALSAVRGMEISKLADITSNNCLELFKLA